MLLNFGQEINLNMLNIEQLLKQLINCMFLPYLKTYLPFPFPSLAPSIIPGKYNNK